METPQCKYCVLLIVAAVLSASCSSSAQPTSNESEPQGPDNPLVFDFDSDTAGAVPAGFTGGRTGRGEPASWRVEESTGAPSGSKVVTQQSEDPTSARYPHLVRDDFSAKDIDIAVSFKTISGEVDASGGLVFRYQDEGNYYVVRANALEDNVVAYKTENGRRSNIGVKGRGNAYGVEFEVPHQAWNRLRVIVRDSRFEIFLNGRKLFEVVDETFADAGQVGLWTKADAVTQFDDLTVAALPGRD